MSRIKAGASASLYAVVMAGGKGTRFWPLSREAYPKQYLSLVGKGTLLQNTIGRLAVEVPAGNISVVTTDGQKNIVQWQTREMGVPVETIVEPEGRNTAPAIALVTYKLHKRDKDAIVFVLPSDHHVGDEPQFIEAMLRAVPVAEGGHIVTFGITPTRPETGFGYINIGKRLVEGVYKVARFVEKPDLATARDYLHKGGYLWNSGMFMFRAADMIEEFKAHMPEVHKVFGALRKHLNTPEEGEALEEVYPRLPSESIDYGVMEKSHRVAVVEAGFPWSDIGSWNALDEVMERDRHGNVVMGNVVGLDCEDSIFYTGEKLVAAVGLRGMVVVDTKDATLIIPKDKVQEVKRLVQTLKHEGKGEYLAPSMEDRPWGYFSVLERGDSYQIKQIYVKPGARLSVQMHNHRSEHWIVVSGTAKVTRGEDEFFVHKNESTFIPPTVRHALENPGKIPLKIIEIQSGEYLGEDDIIRFDDIYGRSKEEKR